MTNFKSIGFFHDRSQPVVGTTTSSPVIGRATTLVMAVACGVVAATMYCNQPMLGLLEAAFPGRGSVAGLAAMASQLGDLS
jgi:hypothetical protein